MRLRNFTRLRQEEKAMAKGINHIVLMGNLVRDPEARFTPSKQEIAAFTLAVGDDYKNKNGEPVKSTDFINCVAWGAQAGAVRKYLSKGAPALVCGKLKIENYVDKTGQKRNAAKVYAASVHLLSGGAKGRKSAYEDGAPEGGWLPESGADVAD